MAEYDLSKLNREYDEAIFNEGPIDSEEELRAWFERRGIEPDNLPVALKVWHEGNVEVHNAPDAADWINIGSADRYADILADGTHVMESREQGSRTAEILTWLRQNCKGPYIVHADGENDAGDVGFEVMLLDKDDLMRFKLSFQGFI